MRFLRPGRPTTLAVGVLGVLAFGAGCSAEGAQTDVVEDPALEPNRELTYDPLEDPAARMLSAQLEPINGSGVTGRASAEVASDGVTVTVVSEGFDDELAHLQLVHARGDGRCPDPSTADDGALDKAAGEDVYGPPMLALTTDGDVSPDNQTDLERFPTPVDERIGYARTVELPVPMQVDDLSGAVVVQYGLPSHGGDAQAYDGDTAGEEGALPYEATLPIACGVLEPTGPTEDGGNDSGGGASDG